MTGSTVLRRVVAGVTALLAVTGAFVAGFLVSGEHRGEPPAYRLTATGLDSGLSCDRLLSWYVDHGVRRVTAWGWAPPVYAEPMPMAPGSLDAAGSPTGAPLGTDTTSGTGTNVQETDVDEPDIVKVSGHLLVRVHDGTLETVDVGGSAPRTLGSAPLERIGDPQVLLSDDRAVVIGSDTEDPAAGASPVAPPSRTWVRTFDLSNPADPTLVDSRLYDGSLVTARQTGTVVRLVLEGGLPTLPFTQPSSTLTRRESLEHNRQVVRDSTVADWLPAVTSYAGGGESSDPFVDCADVSVPSTFPRLGTLSVIGFDPARPDLADATAVTTGSDTAYMSSDHLYVAMSAWSDRWGGLRPMIWSGARGPTRIYAFDLSGTAARYAGMGSVDGAVAGSWSMDEHDGVLRVAAVGPATDAPSTSVVTFRAEAGRLLEAGRVDGLGVAQQLKSVRWFDDIAVLVTFRQTDPFYVVDVSDPTDPHVLGALHLPGWSSYLHPVGPHLVLGLGQTTPREVGVEPVLPRGSSAPMPTLPPLPPSWVRPVVAQRAKATLFDISDPAHPRDVDTASYPAGSMPMAATDPHQVTWLPDRRTLLAVLSEESSWDGLTPQATQPEPRAWIGALTVGDGSLHSRLVPVDATDPGGVRTLPLADGRVVLVAGDSVHFLTV